MNLYYPSNSIFHYMHGFTKILIFGLLFSFIPFWMNRAESLLAMLLVCMALFVYIRPTRIHWLLLIPATMLAVVMGAAYLLDDMGGTVYFHAAFGWWEIRVSSGNMAYALIFILRMLNWSVLFFLLLFTTSPQDLVFGLKRFGLPEFMTLAVSLTLRYWSLMISDTKTVMDAQYCRGVDFREGHPLTRVRRFASLLIPVIFVFLKRFRTTGFALSLKGVGRKNARTAYYHPALTAIDGYAIAAALLIFGSVMALGWNFRL
ncbi:energy-coupling factor transporter transmembrane component T family protein [Paenibacillus hamazuiensis]|uniref:energy-coupling factor transporter transmembrane component T family protein n=1 Tax=Paenibacillus hamazuiensis TaxID=2936508 RepID=UPI002010309D|nr:energy-coupling factor transporter transmembrane component T [Paenibacillus hamazuiensis]